MEVRCPNCEAMLALADSAAGKRALCPNCSSEFRVPLMDAPAIGDVSQSPAVNSVRTGSIQPGGKLIRCPSCDRTLAADPSMAGQAIICPTCKRRMRIPTAEEQSAAAREASAGNPTVAVDARRGSAEKQVDTWVGGSGMPNPYSMGEDRFGNPYSPFPAGSTGMAPAGQRSATNYTLPAIVLLVFSVISMLFFGLAMFGMAVGGGAGAPGQQPPDAVGDGFLVMLFAIAWLANALTFYGGIQMLRRRNLGWARAGAIAALYPCGLCTVLQLPIGVWAIVILFRDSAKRDFLVRSGD